MEENQRLQELRDYHILDTSPEKELDDITEIASALLEAPIALISFVDETRQWFKSNKGLPVSETPRRDAFCQYALHNPEEVLVVDDPCQDERFKDNPLVVGDPNIRFYAGAPLVTPTGAVLGTLCVIDNKPRAISDSQKQALKLLAQKAMDYLDIRSIILEQDDKLQIIASQIIKLSDQAPGAIYQLELRPDGTLTFPFISKGFTSIHPELDLSDLKKDASLAFKVVHPKDVDYVKQTLFSSAQSLSSWNVEYRVIAEDGEEHWHWANAKPERQKDGSVVWYGTFQDITERKEYIKTLEKILFDISHVMRKPVANLLGLTEAIQSEAMDDKTLETYIKHIRTSSEEMDRFIRELNVSYNETRARVSKK